MIASGWGYDSWSFLLGFGAGLACGFLNTAASAGSAVSLPILMMIGLDPVSANATNRIPVLIGAGSDQATFFVTKSRLEGLKSNLVEYGEFAPPIRRNISSNSRPPKI